MRRHHVFGQFRSQRGLQRRFLRRTHDIGHQTQVAGRILARHDHRLRDARLRLQRGLDLSQFDPVAAQLH